MRLRTLAPMALSAIFVSTLAAAQDAASVVAAASKAMAVDTLNSITYSGSARTGAFGQSKSIGEPMGPVNVTQITQYRRTINFGHQPASRPAPRWSPGRPGRRSRRPCPACRRRPRACSTRTSPAHRPAATGRRRSTSGRRRGASSRVRRPITPRSRQQSGVQVVSFTPPNMKSPSGQSYSVTGYINQQNLVTKVETRVENAVVGDLLVEFEYSNYQNMNGVQVPARIVQRQAGLQTFDAEYHVGHAESAEPGRAADRTAAHPPAGRRRAGGAAAEARLLPPDLRRSRRSARGSSRSAATTPPSPSTWAITSW